MKHIGYFLAGLLSMCLLPVVPVVALVFCLYAAGRTVFDTQFTSSDQE